MADYATQFYSTIKNKITKQLASNGYCYSLRYKYKGSNYWVCTEREKCGASLVESNGNYRQGKKGWINGRHSSHLPDYDKVAVKLCFGEAKKVALENPLKTAGEIYDEVTRDQDLSTQALLPPEYLLKKYICRYKVSPHLFTDPQTKMELSLPDTLTSRENLIELSTCEVWIADGTFKTCPKLYGNKGQLYVLHGVFQKLDEKGRKSNTTSLPLVFAVLSNKCEKTYLNFMTALVNLEEKIQLKPKMVIMDYEKGAMNSFASVFPKTKIRGCFFHLTQNVLRKVQELGLQVRYQSDDFFALQVKYLYALAFVKPSEVGRRFAEIMNVLDPSLRPLGTYYNVVQREQNRTENTLARISVGKYPNKNLKKYVTFQSKLKKMTKNRCKMSFFKWIYELADVL